MKNHLEKQWEHYLEKTNQSKDKMSKIQYDETKKAFFAGSAYLMKIMTASIEQPDEKIFQFLDEITEEIAQFWLSQTYKQN